MAKVRIPGDLYSSEFLNFINVNFHENGLTFCNKTERNNSVRFNYLVKNYTHTQYVYILEELELELEELQKFVITNYKN